MRASRQEQTGAVGVNEVMGNFARVGWGPVANDRHDLGTDLFVQVRDDRGHSRGLFLGAQVKAGPSYFKDAVLVGDDVSGWLYREPDVRHFDEWVQHGLPHLLVLHDVDNRVSYWAHVTPVAVEVTGAGAKIFVPKTQTIDLDRLDDLVAVAATQREGVALEGTTWSSSVRDISPARWLRHALLVPRLVAPHPNMETERSIGWPEAVALLSQGRLRDLARFREARDDVPSDEEAAAHREWGWRFVAAYRNYVIGDEPNFAAVLESAPNLESRSATLALESCRLFDQAAYEAAAEILTEAIGGEEVAPVDHAWLLVHRARHAAELGEIERARQDAASCQRALVPETHDLTASVLRAAAGWLLFQSAPFGKGQLEAALTAGDTAAAWWRGQQVATALGEAVTRSFRAWSNEQTNRFETEGVVNNRLFAAQLGAHLAAEHGAWRSTSSLLARHGLMAASTTDHKRLADELDALRRSGDHKAVGLAVEHLWRVGPLEPLSEAASRITERSWTRTTSQANLKLLKRGGDVLPPDQHTALIRYCLGILRSPGEFASRTSGTFIIEHAVIETLSALVAGASDEVRKEIVTYVTNHPAVDDGLHSQDLARLLSQLDPSDVDADLAPSLREAAERQPDPKLSAAHYALLIEDAEIVEQLLERIRDGDQAAMSALQRYDLLDAQAAQQLMTMDADTVDRVVDNAARGLFALGGHDPARELAALASHHPDRAPWTSLMRFLNSEVVPGEHKRAACLVLAARAHHLPPDVTDGLRAALPQLQQSPDSRLRSGFGQPLAGTPVRLAAAIGALDDDSVAGQVARLLAGSSDERRDAAEIARTTPGPWAAGILVALLADPHANVRATAARGLAWLTTDPHAEPDALALAGLERACDLTGVLVPLYVVGALADGSRHEARAGRLASRFSGHRSGVVRSHVAQAIGQ